MRYSILAGGLVAFAAFGWGGRANAQITPQGGGYLFLQKYTAGQKINYVMDMNVTAPGAPTASGAFKMQMMLHLTVLSVKGGVANVNIASDAMTMGGKALKKGENATVKIDSRGQTTGSGDHNGGVAPIFPQGPIKIGGTFTSAAGGATSMGGFSTTTTFRLVGFKVYNGRKVAQLAVTSNIGGKAAGTSSGFMLIAEADGQLVSSRADSSMNVGQNGKNMSVVSHVKIERK